MKYTIHIESRTMLADTLTPVNIYLKLRDVYAGAILLESSDYHGHENSLSFICCAPIASIKVADRLEVRYPDGKVEEGPAPDRANVLESIRNFRDSFVVEQDKTSRFPVGLFGYMAYDAVRFFEDVQVTLADQPIPDVLYKMYRFVIAVDHFSNELTLMQARTGTDDPVQLDDLQQLIFSNRFSTFGFRREGVQTSSLSDDQFLEMVEEGKKHCFRGDVFQIVLSRRFTQSFRGDEFNVYRALRSINPSPYLFYFDYGGFKLFGSSPEAQLQIRNGKASIFPIAGTFRRTGNDQEDTLLAQKLSEDEKENAEHVMLVDLARNDLSKQTTDVQVEVFREIQYYSHVIHLVSRVSGVLSGTDAALPLVADTFPAGTLSGAPKHRAMQLINQYEPMNRSFYGGAIGFMGLQGDFNHAIMIRTFLSRKGQLICQAGAGIVARSNATSELNEVNNKLEALRKAMVMAEQL